MSETRKLQRLGGTSLYVSLPKRWADKMQLKHGGKVTLICRVYAHKRQWLPVKKKVRIAW